MKQVLVIDDEEQICQIYQRLFQASASTLIEIHTANCLEEARDIVSKKRMDMVLLDIQMQPGDGPRTAVALRQSQPGIKIIVSSVYPIEQQRQLIPDALDYYDKSEGLVTLLDKVSSALS